MHVYMSKIHAYTSVRICTYIQQYFCMYFQQYICPYFCMYIQQYSVTVPVTVPVTRSQCRQGCFAFAGAGARSLHLRRAVATASLSRGSARHIAKFNQIWSARQNSGSQRQLVEARAEVSLRAEVPWQSWLAVVHEVTAEKRRPSDVEKMRSLSNRQPLMRKRSRIFWNQLHTEIQAQKNQRSRLQSY